MTLKDRNEISNRERIKQFIEVTMRSTCDDMSDDEITNIQVLDIALDLLKKLSEIYKNMGFDNNIKETFEKEAKKFNKDLLGFETINKIYYEE